MTAGALDDHPFEQKCPTCGVLVRATVGQVRRSPTLTCPNGHEVKVNATHLDRDQKNVDKALDDLLRAL
jgi:hypothetical protein